MSMVREDLHAVITHAFEKALRPRVQGIEREQETQARLRDARKEIVAQGTAAVGIALCLVRDQVLLQEEYVLFGEVSAQTDKGDPSESKSGPASVVLVNAWGQNPAAIEFCDGRNRVSVALDPHCVDPEVPAVTARFADQHPSRSEGPEVKAAIIESIYQTMFRLDLIVDPSKVGERFNGNLFVTRVGQVLGENCEI